MSYGNGNIIRKHKNSNFTVVDNEILKNNKLSLKAKGLLVILLSLPDDWEFSVSGLSSLSKDGRDSTRSTLKELENNGYLKMEQTKNDDGMFGKVVYNVYEVPFTGNPSTGNPFTDKPFTDIPHNKELIYKELNNKELNTIVELENSTVPYKEIIDYLNEKSNRQFKVVESHKRHIRARWNEGYRLEDFKKVVDNKTQEWLNDSTMNQYLRPQTLFGTKFDSYLNTTTKLNTSKKGIGEFT